ncbi:MAG: thiolase family protein [Rhodospirillales bacterium]|nr:thiolase family protein [Rhodospirillales bacterium]
MSYIAEIPYGCYWSTPFAKWQGSFSTLNSLKFAAQVVKAEMGKRKIPGQAVDYGVLGISVPQRHSFYGLPWVTGMAGLTHVGGPTLMQACATGARLVFTAAQEIQSGLAQGAIAIGADRVSNGPQIYYPNQKGPGGTGEFENWTMDNFAADPLGGHSMLNTAENVAKRHQIDTKSQHEVVLRRCDQYKMALADDSAFLKRFMTLPFEVPSGNPKKPGPVLQGDEGVTISTAEGLAKLKPVLEGGTITFGGQTYPSDGNAGMILATPERAKEISKDPKIRIRLMGFGLARVELAYMPEAPVPAERKALAQAGITIKDLAAVKTHNPFAVNDLYFAKETGYDVNQMNNYGCSLIWGHPQSPMGLRALMELIEELVKKGGGYGLFTGCAAGDTGMAVVLKVGD